MKKAYVAAATVLLVITLGSFYFLFQIFGFLYVLSNDTPKSITTTNDNKDSNILTYGIDGDLQNCLGTSKNISDKENCYQKILPHYDSLLNDIYIFLKTNNNLKTNFVKNRADSCNSDKTQSYNACYIQKTKEQINTICSFDPRKTNCQDMI